jgi:beta-glucosidase
MASAKKALEQKLMTEEDLDASLSRVLKTRFMLGEFDEKASNPFTGYDESLLAGKAHAELALQASRESIVLLKNESILPLRKNAKVAVIGPLADINYREWYTGIPPYEVTALDGFTNAGGDIVFASGRDKITLKTADGGYIGVDASTRELRSGFSKNESALFALDDFGWDEMVLRHTQSDKYLSSEGGRVTADADAIWGWFIRQRLSIMPHKEKYYITDLDGKYFKNDNGVIKSVNRAVLSDDRLFGMEVVEDGIQKAVEAAKASEYAVVVVGNHPHIGAREGRDRTDIIMPPQQERLIKAVYEANKNTIVVIVAGYHMVSEFVEENVPAILYGAHSVQEMGNALADIIYGGCSPSARLSQTWYRYNEQLPDIMDYDIIHQKATYLYTEAIPRYPFGFGLSYSGFSYGDFKSDKTVYEKGDCIKLSVDVKNTGGMEAQEVVQAYVSIKQSKVKRGNRQLKAFTKVNLAPGETKTVPLEINTDELRIWDVRTDRYLLESGDYAIDIAKDCLTPILSAEVRVNGEEIADRDMRRVIQAMNCDDYDRISLGECKYDGGVAVMGCQGKLLYNGCAFNGENTFTALVSLPVGGQSLTVLADDEILCEIDVPPTGGKQEWVTCQGSFPPVFGVRDVVLRFNGNIKEFKFEKH